MYVEVARDIFPSTRAPLKYVQCVFNVSAWTCGDMMVYQQNNFTFQHNYVCSVCNTAGDRMKFYRPIDMICRKECYDYR